jgi:hypothetical protein
VHYTRQREQRQHGRIQLIDLYFHHGCNGRDRQGKVISAVGIAGPRERVEPNIDAFAEVVSAAASELRVDQARALQALAKRLNLTETNAIGHQRDSIDRGPE